MEYDIKISIQNYEHMYVDTKKQLENVYKDKEHFPPADDLTIWYKEYLHWLKNLCKSEIKYLIAWKEWEQIGGPMPC